MTKVECHLDFETRSEADLKKVGAHAYFEHPSTQVLCAAYAFGDEEPEIWLPDDLLFPKRLKEHVQNGGIITAWNAAFERLAWQYVMHKKHHWAPVHDHQWQCTMTESLSMNMPGQLKDAAPAFGLEIVKDDVGQRLMMKMCKPRKARKDEDPNKVYWHEDFNDILRLAEYCKQDVRVEAQIGKRVMRLRPSENKLYLLDMKINDRGVFIDRKLCESASHIVETATDRLDDEMRRVTRNEVSACSSVVQLIKFLGSKGVKTASVDKESIEDLLITELPDDCRRALELRQEGSKTSTAKIESMLGRQQRDGRMRGNLQFYGASATGRWAARGAQLQNLTRPKILGSDAFKPTPLDDQIQSAVDCIHLRSSMVVELLYGQPLTLVSDCIRSMICAPEGKILRSSDFNNIEGRVVAWLAGQQDKLDAFRAFDNKTGPDLYLIQAAGIFNVPLNEAYQHRQIGKVAELALGFGGGPRAFAKMAKNYGVRIGQQFDGIWGLAAENLKETALKAWDERGRKTGMSREAWLASEVIKLAWRAKNWRIESLWKEVEDAAIEALQNKGETIQCGKVKFRNSGSFLFCQLPSGRSLTYPYARLKQVETPWGGMRQQMVFKCLDPFTRKWGETGAYGGHLVENCLAAGTNVLTSRGVVGIASVLKTDKLWDGGSWVSHEGLVYQGEKSTINLKGLRMTPDHKVLTTEGWINASSCRGYSWSKFRVLDSVKLRWIERKKIAMASALCLRFRKKNFRIGAEKTKNEFVRVQERSASIPSSKNARYEPTSELLGLAFDGGSLRVSSAQGVPPIRWTRHHCLRRVEKIVSEFLAGHGSDVCAGVNVGAYRQQFGIQKRKLSLGDANRSSKEYAGEHVRGHTERPNASMRSFRNVGHKRHYIALPYRRQLASIKNVLMARLHQQNKIESVYDLVNAGPNHRFTVVAPSGRLMIVSNCTQAVARDVMAEAMVRVDAAKYNLVLSVHDEIVTEDQLGFGSMKEFNALMAATPTWAEGLPISVSGWEGSRYHK